MAQNEAKFSLSRTADVATVGGCVLAAATLAFQVWSHYHPLRESPVPAGSVTDSGAVVLMGSVSIGWALGAAAILLGGLLHLLGRWQSARLVKVATKHAEGVWLKARVLEGDAAHVKDFAHQEHLWRMDAITVVTAQISAGKGHWVGDAVNELPREVENVRKQYSHLGQERTEIVARINLVTTRLGSVITDLISKSK